MAYCKVCREELVEGSKFCVKCGTPVEVKERDDFNVLHFTANTEPKDKENQKQSKTKKKLLIGLISAGVVGVLAIIAVVLLMVFNKTAKVDIGSFVLVEYSGYDTVGEATVKIDEDELIEAIADSLGKDEDDVAEDIKRLVESFSYEISGNGILANGDKIKITVKYDEEMAEECKLEILNTSLSNEVENLQEFKEIDPFQYLKVEFEGVSGEGKCLISKDDTLEITGKLNFIIDKENSLSNGDKIKISLDNSEVEKGLKAGYKFIHTSREYQVDGLETLTDSEKAVVFKEYVAKLSDAEKAQVYITIISIPPAELIQQQINSLLSQYTIEEIREIIIQNLPEEMEGINGNKEEYEAYVLSMDEEQVQQLYSEMVEGTIRRAYAEQVEEHLAGFTIEELVDAFENQLVTYSTEQCAAYYDIIFGN